MDTKEIFDALGIDEKDLDRLAKQLSTDPEIAKFFRQQAADPEFQQTMDGLYEDLREAFNEQPADNDGTKEGK